MNTLKTTFASNPAALPLPRRSAVVGWLATWWQRLGRSDEERFLAAARGPEDLERRLRYLERHGIPRDPSATM